MKPKLFFFFLALVASVGMLHAQSGTCGANLTWNLTDGVLTISGTGNMYDYSVYSYFEIPWIKSMGTIGRIVIENGVTSIGNWAFFSCGDLTSATIGNSVTSIGEGAFSGCSSLTSITIPNSVTSIGMYAFHACSSLPIIEDVRYADTYLIEAVDTSLSTYTIKDGTKWIGSLAFFECSSLTSVNIPNSVTSIGESAFLGCSSLTSVTIGNGVTSIGEGAFYGCSSLTSVTIPNSVTSIGGDAFYGCSGLKNLILGANLKTIETNAFKDCSVLETITCYSMRPPTVNKAFPNLLYSTIIYVPADYVTYYMVHDMWGMYDVRPLGATSVQITDLQITPDDNTANVVWPTVENAATYEMIIKDMNGVIVCTLIFNANGQLTSIAFAAPGRSPASTQSAGFSFTVTGLDGATLYDLTMTAKDNSGNILQTTTKSFATNGYTGIDNIESSAEFGGQKILRNGHLLILRDGKTYTVQGKEVR